MSRPHEGMPPFDQAGPALSFFEFWPMWAFYPPVFIYVLWLMIRYRGVMLPTVANPSFPGGGLVGESKAEILSLLVKHVPEWVASYIKLTKRADVPVAEQTTSAIQALADAGLALPVVAKPDLGCRGAGVKLVHTYQQLENYIASFPDCAEYILQRLVDCEGEAGVFYCRHPDQPRGEIISLTLKYFPYVYGDGQRTLRELILQDARAGRVPHLYLSRHVDQLDKVPSSGEAIRLAFAGSHSRGAIFRDGSDLITPQMRSCFESIARRLPEFYFGRFDIRFADFSEVQAGRALTIVEANGAGAESTHIWDRKTSLWRAWGDLMRQYRLLFQIGAANRARGFKALTFAEFRRWHQREKALVGRYPATD